MGRLVRELYMAYTNYTPSMHNYVDLLSDLYVNSSLPVNTYLRKSGKHRIYCRAQLREQLSRNIPLDGTERPICKWPYFTGFHEAPGMPAFLKSGFSGGCTAVFATNF